MTDFIVKLFDAEVAIAMTRKYTHDDVGEGELEPYPGESAAGFPMAGVGEGCIGLDVAAGLVVWKNEVVYRDYLRKFARDYEDVVREMKGSEPPRAAALAHRLKGAAASLALKEVAACASALEHVLCAGQDASAHFSQLQLALGLALNSIERYAAVPVVSSAAEVSAAIDPKKLADLLARALWAMDSDAPDAVEPILAELAELLPPGRLANVRAAVEQFDFRGGEAAIHQLAAESGVVLE